MAHWKLILMYDGSSFHGWQVQPGLRTVQGMMSDALRRLTGESVLPQGSGRTDAGVHALGQVCSFTLRAPLPAANLQRALNRVLPPAVRVLSAAEVPPGFHARTSARRKTYEYRLLARRGLLPRHPDREKPKLSRTSRPETEGLEAGDLKAGELGSGEPHTDPRDAGEERICSPFLAPFVWDVRWPLDLASMQQAAAFVCGTHDFTSFAAVDPDRSHRQGEPLSSAQDYSPKDTSAIRSVFDSRWERRDDLLIYRVTGNGFLHHMVRNLVGTLVDVGRGSLSATALPAILAARDRSAAGPTAPARGLFLVSVDYDEDPAREVSA